MNTFIMHIVIIMEDKNIKKTFITFKKDGIKMQCNNSLQRNNHKDNDVKI